MLLNVTYSEAGLRLIASTLTSPDHTRELSQSTGTIVQHDQCLGANERLEFFSLLVYLAGKMQKDCSTFNV